MYDMTIAFVNCHLASKNLKARRQQYMDLVGRYSDGARWLGVGSSDHRETCKFALLTGRMVLVWCSAFRLGAKLGGRGFQLNEEFHAVVRPQWVVAPAPRMLD